MHGWWIDGEYVPCACARCVCDREEAEEAAYLAKYPDADPYEGGNELYAALMELPALLEA